MLQRRIAALAVMTAGIIFTALPPSAAGDFYSRHHYQHRQSQLSFSTNGLPSTLSGGTYVGGISALRVRGNGNYFAINGGLSRQGATVNMGAQPGTEGENHQRPRRNDRRRLRLPARRLHHQALI